MGNGFVDDNSSLLLQYLFQGPQTVHDHNGVLVTKQTVELVHQSTICKAQRSCHQVLLAHCSLITVCEYLSQKKDVA